MLPYNLFFQIYPFNLDSSIYGPIGSLESAHLHYDQLNRIVAMDQVNGLHTPTGTFTPSPSAAYQERISYDANGNILTYRRNGDSSRLSMDELSYFYKQGTNQLQKVTDAAQDATDSTYSRYNDLRQGQADNNYRYDAIGNLTADAKDSITSIQWNVYGKISSITKNASVIRYIYDASGNRILKYTPTDATAYVRDASGNVLSVYTATAGPDSTVVQLETHLYGSSRLGMATRHQAADSTIELAPGFGKAQLRIFTSGEKLFELSNHLGNVLATVSDRKIALDTTGDGFTDSYIPDVISAQDYYPFGMQMPERKYAAGTYRYGFNGKENDNEVKGLGNQQDYGMRIYDPRLGRFLSVDPLTQSYPMLTPYQFASNRPIEGIDLDGEEFLSFHKSMYRMQYYVSKTTANDIVNVVYENIPTPLQDSKTKSFKYVSNGPITSMGRDYKPAELSGILYNRDKHFKNGPKFYGLADGGQDPEPTGSTSGMGGAAVNQTRNRAANAAGGALGEEGAGVVSNVWNAFGFKRCGGQKWGALSDEVQLRKGFYDATNLVNYQIKNNMIGNKSLTEGAGRSALINFLSDGYLPTDQGNDFALQVAYEGVQQMNIANIDIQDKTKESIHTLLNQYKKDGGGNRYDKLNTFLNQKKK